MDGSSLSGHWGSAATIRFENITRLNLNAGSFDYKSASPGPVVEVVGVDELEAAGAFSGPVAKLTLRAVKGAVKTCSSSTFGQRIGHLTLDGITVEDVNKKCFTGGSDSALHSIAIRSCTLSTIRSGAFWGEMDTIEIDNSKIGRIDEAGFNVTAAQVSIVDSSVQVLTRNSLQIRARHSVVMSSVWAEQLERDALAALRSAAAAPLTLRLRDLRVADANDGSLALHSSVSVCLTRLEIGHRRPRPCPVEPLARRLVGCEDGRPLSAAQLLVLDQLQRPDSCPADRRPLSAGCERAPFAAGLTAAVAVLALLSAVLAIALTLLLVGGRARRVKLPRPRKLAIAPAATP